MVIPFRSHSVTVKVPINFGIVSNLAGVYPGNMSNLARVFRILSIGEAVSDKYDKCPRFEMFWDHTLFSGWKHSFIEGKPHLFEGKRSFCK